MLTKKDIREYIKLKKNKFLNQDKNIFDKHIFYNVTEDKQYLNSKCVFIYVSFNREVDTYRIIKHAIENNKIVCVPKVVSKLKGMKAVKIKTLEDLKEGKYGILEPVSFDNEISEKNIDLVITPGVAFDTKGGRIGYGGGFYDRFLKKLNPTTVKIGLAYDFQIVKCIPVEKHDTNMDKIITNSRLIDIKSISRN